MNPSSWPVAGFLFTAITGTFLHFLYDLTGQSIPAALISAVNESIGEHMKLLFFPMLLFSFVEYVFREDRGTGFWCRKGKSIGLGLVLIPVLYYSYTGILGISASWFNVTIFFLAAGAAWWRDAKLSRKAQLCRIPEGMAVVLLLGIGVLFAVLTFLPPEIPFFRDPVTGTYGFQG